VKLTRLMRSGWPALPAALTLALAACSTSSTPSPVKVSLFYTAIGASDAVGIGASVPCGTLTPASPSCPGGTGYVPVIARMLQSAGNQVTLDDLGISGAVIGPDILALGNSYGLITSTTDPCKLRGPSDTIPGDFITNELPSVSAKTTDVTIYAGGNDTIALANALLCQVTLGTITTTAQQQAFITQEITSFGTDYAKLLAGLKGTSPKAHIAVMNLPNFALLPFSASFPASEKATLQAFSVGFALNVINPLAAQGIPVIDLLCNAQSYNPANYSSDGFHPNDAGYAISASLLEPALVTGTASPPATSCTYIGSASSSVENQPLTGKERAILPNP
jgi:lysophospholipase L1-like esterase